MYALQLPDDQEWKKQAACRGADPDLFFPDRADGCHGARAAKRICATCAVRSPCLEFGLRERYGVWGGYTFSDRREILRARKAKLNATSNSTSPARRT